MKKFLLFGLVILTLQTVGCGGGSEESTARDTPPTTTADNSTWPELEDAAAGEGGGPPLVPTGSPPKKVLMKDLRKGKGPVIGKGDWFLISYVAYNFESRAVAEDKRGPNSWNWLWGTNELSQGWEIGLRGLRVGGVRELIVPSRLAYETGARVYILRLRKLADAPEAAS
jgi:peptidylprolyl isomerase